MYNAEAVGVAGLGLIQAGTTFGDWPLLGERSVDRASTRFSAQAASAVDVAKPLLASGLTAVLTWVGFAMVEHSWRMESRLVASRSARPVRQSGRREGRPPKDGICQLAARISL